MTEALAYRLAEHFDDIANDDTPDVALLDLLDSIDPLGVMTWAQVVEHF